MIEIKNGKNGKKLKKEIAILKLKFKDVELRPCHGDEDLRQKDSDLATLRREIYSLEKKVNRFPTFIPCLRARQ